MEIDKEYLKKIIEEKSEKLKMINENNNEEFSMFSKEYALLKEQIEESKKRKHWYEKLASYTSGIKMTLAPKDKERIRKGIMFSGLKIREEDVILVPTMFFGVMLLIQFVFYVILKIIGSIWVIEKGSKSIWYFFHPAYLPAMIKYGPFLIGVIGAYYLYRYPFMRSTKNRIQYGEQLLMAIVYMIVYLRTSGNLEGALRYAAQNTHGKVAQDLRELIWKIEMREYLDVYSALNEYANMWKDHMKEFSQAIYLINEAMIEPDPSRRDMLLEKSLGVVLDSYNERMKAYSRALELPIQIIHALGIILPVLGMVVLPILTILLSDSLSNLSFYLISFYDVILPIILIFFINKTLEKRPPTFGRVKIENHPNLPPKGYFRMNLSSKIKDIKISTVIYTLLGIFLLPSLLSFLYFYYHNGNSGTAVTLALLSVFFFSATIITYSYLYVTNRLTLRKEIESIEKEFEDALFALGNSLASGMPLEKALSKAISDLGNLKIRGLFERILNNIHQFSLTFKDALFHPTYGVIKYYPSDLIKNILRILASVIEKGTQNAALAMITISRYLKDIKTTQAKIEDLLSSTLSSMRFNAYVLIPVVGGIIVAVSKLVLALLLKMSGVYQALTQQLTAESAQGLMESGFIFNVDQAIPTSLTLFIIGVYIVEMLYILGLFIARTQYGFDEIMEKNEIWKLTLIGSLVFILTFLIINGLFSGVIDSIMESLGAI